MQKNNILLLIFLVTLFSSCQSIETSAFDLHITPQASLPIGRAAASSFVVDEKAYVLFGRKDKRDGYLSDFLEYTPAKNTWAKLTDIPCKGRVQAVAEVVDNKAYVGLGFNGRVYNEASYLRDFWMYDPADSTWTRKADFPNKMTNAGISFAHETYIYVCSSYYDTSTRNLYRYCTKNDKWEECEQIPIAARFGGVGIKNQERFFWGMGFNSEMLGDWYEFYPETQTWKTRAKIPQKGRVFHSAVAFNNEILIMGGRFWGGTETREEFYEEIFGYNIDTDEWTLRGYLPNGGCENMITFTVNNKSYFGLGENAKGEIRNDLYCIE